MGNILSKNLQCFKYSITRQEKTKIFWESLVEFSRVHCSTIYNNLRSGNNPCSQEQLINKECVGYIHKKVLFVRGKHEIF